ncbi:MAG: proline--tRNA ligase [Neisseriaceae bacterium]
MKTSHYYINTLKEVPNEAQLPSHRLMLKAGLIRKVASGLYTWLPLGLRVLKKIEKIIREEMDKVGALELVMPTIQPAELWKESLRWEQYGKELLRIVDRHGREFCYGPTHEEMITDIVRAGINSYKQLPITFYQIQNKFRDEIRPRFGVMRSREFIMKDAYSFHEDSESVRQTYQAIYGAYTQIFKRLGLNFRAVIADNGNIGGAHSHEFQVIAENGEDTIAYSTESEYAANIELAPTPKLARKPATPKQELKLVVTPIVDQMTELADFFQSDLRSLIKPTMLVDQEGELVLLLLRADHELNEIKVAKLPQLNGPLQIASDVVLMNSLEGEEAREKSIVAFNFQGRVYADFALATGNDWILASTQLKFGYTGFNFRRDLKEPEFVDLRNVVEGDPSPDGKGVLRLTKGIEVGHIFELGDKYSQLMGATFLDQSGKRQVMHMGCYGIGVTRIVAAAIEQCHDDRGIIWPLSLAPFSVVIVPTSYHKNEEIKEYSDRLYQSLLAEGIEVLLEDRKERIGVLLNDSELLGIPHRLVIGEKGLLKGVVEHYERKSGVSQEVKVEEVIAYCVRLVQN